MSAETTPSRPRPVPPTPEAMAEFQELLRRLQARDPDAWRRLHDAYSHPLRMVIRRLMNPALHSVCDSGDLLQEV